MSRSRRFTRPLVAAFALSWMPVVAAAQQPRFSYSPHFCQIWNVATSPNLPQGDSSLGAIAAVSPNDVWAVGHTYDYSDGQTLILHWNGVEWTDVSTPDPGLGGWLYGVEVASPNDV